MKVLDWVLGKTINYPSGSLHLGVLGIGYWVLGIGYWVLGIGYRHNLVRGGGESCACLTSILRGVAILLLASHNP